MVEERGFIFRELRLAHRAWRSGQETGYDCPACPDGSPARRAGRAAQAEAVLREPCLDRVLGREWLNKLSLRITQIEVCEADSA